MIEPVNFEVGDQTRPSLKSIIWEFFETLVVFAALGTVVYLFIAQPHKVSGCSMCPNFHTNDYIITSKINYRITSPQRGQVIVFQNPRDLSQDFIKRIIGLPGDRVKIQAGKVYVNGVALNESYLSPDTTTNAGSFAHEGEEITVPQNQYFVLGDNRNQSSDSREWGLVTREEIVGLAVFRYWPSDVVGVIPQATY